MIALSIVTLLHSLSLPLHLFYLLGNILSASGFSVLWAIFVHNREDAGPQDYISDCNMHVLVIASQMINWVLGCLSRGSRNIALQLKSVCCIRAFLITGLQEVSWVFLEAFCFSDFLQDFFFMYLEDVKWVFFSLWCFT